MISDLIATGKEAEQLVAQQGALMGQVADLQNQIDTASLQHTNDQTTISAMNTQVVTLQASLFDARTSLAAANQQVSDEELAFERANEVVGKLQADLDKLNSVKVYDGLEYNAWAINSKAQVGGSGVGTSGYKVPDATGMAELWIKPGPRPDPTKPNYYDSYDTQDFLPLDDAITRWRMENTFLFPTQADADACNCLELEARQVLLNGNMYVGGTQFNFGNNAWRYWDHFKKWTPSGQPCPIWTAGKLYHAAVDAHRDDANTYHDSISLNDQKVPLAVSYSTWKESPAWRQMLRCAIQLDAKDVAFRVLIGRTKFTVSQ